MQYGGGGKAGVKWIEVKNIFGEKWTDLGSDEESQE
jgi:hypothetical protein